MALVHDRIVADGGAAPQRYRSRRPMWRTCAMRARGESLSNERLVWPSCLQFRSNCPGLGCALLRSSFWGSMIGPKPDPSDLYGVIFHELAKPEASPVDSLRAFQRQAKERRLDLRLISVDGDPLLLLKSVSFFFALHCKNAGSDCIERGLVLLDRCVRLQARDPLSCSANPRSEIIAQRKAYLASGRGWMWGSLPSAGSTSPSPAIAERPIASRGICQAAAERKRARTRDLLGRARSIRRAHRPIEGNCILEADPAVAQPINRELGPAHHIIGCTSAFHIVTDGLGAKAQNRRDLRVGLAHGHKAEALELAAAEVRTRRLRRKGPQPPRRAKRVQADQLRAAQTIGGNLAAGAHGERAGSTWLSRNVCRNREPATESMIAAPRENVLVAPVEPDQRA